METLQVAFAVCREAGDVEILCLVHDKREGGIRRLKTSHIYCSMAKKTSEEEAPVSNYSSESRGREGE